MGVIQIPRPQLFGQLQVRQAYQQTSRNRGTTGSREERATSAAWFFRTSWNRWCLVYAPWAQLWRLMAFFAGSTASNKDAPKQAIDFGRQRLILEPHDGHPVGLVVLQHFLVPPRQVNKDPKMVKAAQHTSYTNKKQCCLRNQ